MSKDGGPAFPHEPFHNPAYPERGGVLGTRGMSLRDYCAVAALQGMLSDCATQERIDAEAKRRGIAFGAACAQMAYDHADAMLKARATAADSSAGDKEEGK